MNVICINCKMSMECTDKREMAGTFSTMSDYQCPGCHAAITIGRKGLHKHEKVKEEGDD